MVTNAHLTPEPESARVRVRQFQEMLRETEIEADREGIVTIDQAMAEIDAIIDANDR
jgi:hypothetical protein